MRDYYPNLSVWFGFTEGKLCQLLFLSFGILCTIQATLNVSLRLACEYVFGVLSSAQTAQTKATISHRNVAVNVFCVFAESYFKCNVLFWDQCTQARSPLTQNATRLVWVTRIWWKWNRIVSEEGRNTATNYKRDSTPWPEKKTSWKTEIIYSPTCWGRRRRRGTGCLWSWGVGK